MLRTKSLQLDYSLMFLFGFKRKKNKNGLVEANEESFPEKEEEGRKKEKKHQSLE